MWSPGRRCSSRCSHQEGDFPQDVVPREETFSRNSQEADVLGKEMSLRRCHPLEGNIPSKGVLGKMMSQGRTYPQVEGDHEKMWSLGRRCVGRRCLWEGNLLRKKTSLEGDVPSKERCHPQGVVPRKKMSGKISSPGRRHPPQGCPWEGVIHREVSLEKCQEKDVPGKT